MKNRIKLIITDMDGTLVDYSNSPFHSSWDALYNALGLGEENSNLLKKYYDKKESEVEWTDQQVGLLKGRSLKQGLSGLFPIPYSKGAKEFFTSLNSNYIKGILTTGINLVADVAKEELNMHFSLSFIINHSNGIFDGTYKPRVWLWSKADRLKELASHFYVNLEKICFIGDNNNDIPCFKIAGLPIAFNPKTEETRKNARYVINDFMELKKILNII